MTDKIMLYLYSRRNIVGCTFALVGVALFFSGVIRDYAAFIIVGLYVAGTLILPGKQAPVLLLSTAGVQNQKSVAEIQKALYDLEDQLEGRITKPIWERLHNLVGLIEAALPGLARMASGDRTAWTVKQVATDYLPGTFENYLKLPTIYASRHRLRNGKTPHDTLLQQLDLLTEEMQSLLADIHAADSTSLEAHGRFLEDKFGKRAEFKL